MLCPPLSLWFSHRYSSVKGTIARNNRAQTYVIIYYELYTLEDLFTYVILILGRGSERSVKIFIGTLWIVPISVEDFANKEDDRIELCSQIQ